MKRYLLIIFTLLLAPSSLSAQSNAVACNTNRNAPPVGTYYWPPDSNIKVYFRRGMFSPEQQRSLIGAMEIWSTAATRMGAAVKFTYAGEADGPHNCQGCLTVMRAQVHRYNPEAYAFFVPLRRDAEGRLISAEIQLDFKTTSPLALQGYMVHELGHGLGLWDCVSCKRKQTIMNGFPGINRDNGLVAPSTCDEEVVRQVYRAERSQAVASTTAASPR